MQVVTISAKKDRRLLVGNADGFYQHLKRSAHRAHRRASNVALQVARLTGEYTPRASRCVTGWEVA